MNYIKQFKAEKTYASLKITNRPRAVMPKRG